MVRALQIKLKAGESGGQNILILKSIKLSHILFTTYILKIANEPSLEAAGSIYTTLRHRKKPLNRKHVSPSSVSTLPTPRSSCTDANIHSFSDLVMCRKQSGIAIGRLCDKCDGKCPVCDSYVRPTTLVRICDECSFGNYQNKCVVCGGEGISDAFYCFECTRLEKDRDGCPKIINLGSSRVSLSLPANFGTFMLINGLDGSFLSKEKLPESLGRIWSLWEIRGSCLAA